MKIAIDVSPIKDVSKLAHRVRGTGFYISNLKKALLEFYPNNKYVLFSNAAELPSNADITHYPYFEPFFISLPLIKKTKTVVTVHDLTPLVFPKYFKVGLKGVLKWQAQKLALKNTNAVITDSISSKKDIVKHAGIEESKINVIYLAAGEEFKGIQNSSVRQAQDRIRSLRKKYNLPDKFALYVGDVTWNKNLPRLIEAVKKTKVPLVMVGSALVKENVDLSNPWNADFAKVIKLVEGDSLINRLGFISNEELVSLYSMATVFTMPSLYEGFGLPVLEAMSCGCPVITSKEGSIPEIAGKACRYVDAYDIDNIAEGINEVFNNENLRQELSKKGLVQSKKFTWEKTASETMDAYRRVTGLR